MHFTRFAGFHYQPGLHAQTLADEVMVDGGRGQQGRHRNPVRPFGAVRQDEDVLVRQHRFGGGPAHFLQRQFQTGGACLGIPRHVDGFGTESAIKRDFDRTDLGEVRIGEDRLINFQALVRPSDAAEQVRARANHRDEAHDQLFADRIDRRVGDLREILLEIVVKQA